MQNLRTSKFECSIALLPLIDDITVICAVITNVIICKKKWLLMMINNAIIIVEKNQCTFLHSTTS